MTSRLLSIPLLRFASLLVVLEAGLFAVLGWSAYHLAPGNAPWYALLPHAGSPSSTIERALAVGPYVLTLPIFLVAAATLFRGPARKWLPLAGQQVSLLVVAAVNLLAIPYWINDLIYFSRDFDLTLFDVVDYAVSFMMFALISIVSVLFVLGSRTPARPG